MIERLKVSDFYKESEINCVREIEYLQKAFFEDEKMYYTTKDAPILLY
jgi:hypothetical protein